MTNCNEPIGNRTRDLLSQPTVPLNTPQDVHIYIYPNLLHHSKILLTFKGLLQLNERISISNFVLHALYMITY
jgi:hypothetical protein